MRAWGLGGLTAMLLIGFLQSPSHAAVGERRTAAERSRAMVARAPVLPARLHQPRRRGVAARSVGQAARRSASPVRSRMPRPGYAIARQGSQRFRVVLAAACPRGRACRGVAAGPRLQTVSWTQGLSPAAGVQAADCPLGTMPMPVRGHDDVVRCVPI